MEDIFFEKVRQRTLTKENESKTILNTFKYYDFEKVGHINLECFTDVLKYYGCFFNRNELLALFNRYDLNANRNSMNLRKYLLRRDRAVLPHAQPEAPQLTVYSILIYLSERGV